ncbi:outer membrane protein assembly factor BamB [Methanofollis sp. W23]|uniref:hypothetical protein n=1 Tax=Methanofollis sp. W23 TaxID=2817849 RepID=UPI001AE6A68B|nr:hypothetical protein [Methanofollis sp. W23]MBP2145355.1 outer membrane protein assembly factor BamB [Methanofollis sp. W23]
MPSQKIVFLEIATVLIAFTLTGGCAVYKDNTNFQDIGVVRTDAEGETLWEQTIDDSGYGDYLQEVTASPDGRVFVVSILTNPPKSNLSMDTNWVACLGPDGKKLWNWSGSSYPDDLAPSPDGGCIAVFGYGGIVKIRSDGRTGWTVPESEILEQFSVRKRPSSADMSAIAQTESGRYIVGGDLPTHSPDGALCVQIDENGTVLDAKKYTGQDNPLWRVGAIVPMSDSGCGVVGDLYEQPRLARLNARGDILWNVSVPFSSSGYDYHGIREIEAGSLELLVVERGYGDPDQVRNIVYDPEGAVLREETFAIPSSCPITWASDGGYVVAALMDNEGVLSSSASDGGSRVHLIKYNETGHQEWDRTVGSKSMDSVKTIDPIGENGYVIAGEIKR